MEPRRSAGDAVPRRRLASVQQRDPAGPSSGVFDTSGMDVLHSNVRER